MARFLPFLVIPMFCTLTSCKKSEDHLVVKSKFTFNGLVIDRLPNGGSGTMGATAKEFDFTWNGGKLVIRDHQDGSFSVTSGKLKAPVKVSASHRISFNDDGTLTLTGN